jgi:nitroimidazol reductase NimA-like FMN-containing flavoprotein (pyridoxamine 5'-phosphate oxidase superfamily)
LAIVEGAGARRKSVSKGWGSHAMAAPVGKPSTWIISVGRLSAERMTAIRMNEAEIDTLLKQQGVGVLSLAADADSYAVPESFGYDGDHLYFQLVYDDDSEKYQYLDKTELVTFTVFSEDPARSVVVRGRLEPVSADEELLAAEAIAENADIPTLNVMPETRISALTAEHHRLVPEEMSGRAFDGSPT